MKERAAMMATAFVLLSSINADARDPFENEWPSLPIVERPADPAPFVIPAGLYYVTDTYVDDVVATNGATTTYSTTTVHESTGTYARVVDVVDTGASSAFDGTSFNGRGALTDGRALAGTYYENFVLTANGYVPVSIVFFQDDSESKRRAAAPSSSPLPSPSAAPSATAATPTPASTPTHKDGPVAPRSVVTPGPTFQPISSIAPPAPRLRAGVALAPDGATLASAEVLRGRLVYFWPRAFANDIAMPIRSWRLLSAEPDHISAASGRGTDPLGAQWLHMPAPGVRWSLRFEVFPETAPAERLEAEISVTVRSPALID
jgi:hypothetical protein